MGWKLLLGLLLLAPLAFYPFLRDTTAYNRHNQYIPPPEKPLTAEEEQSREMEKLAKNDPVKLLERGLERYQKEVQGYKLIFIKQEKVNDKLREAEVIRVHFREKPFSVHMNWIEGIDLCYRSLYVEGQNNNRIAVRPCLIGGIHGPILRRPLDAGDVKSSSRFPVTRFGLYAGAKGTLQSIHEAQEKGTLHLRYDGIERVEKAGHRPCYKLVRWKYDPPEEKEGLNELTIYIDQATLFQVGSILRDAKGEFIAEYFFRDIELNPTFDEKQFTEKTL